MGITCGSMLAVGSGDQVKLYKNYDVCAIIMGAIIGLAIFGTYLHKKEKKSSTLQKKYTDCKQNDWNLWQPR